MDIPIAEKLIPNLLTMAAQLCATGVIYLLYMKFLQEPVSKYLDARAEKMESDLKDAQASKESSHKILEETKETHAYTFVITSLPESISAMDVLSLYRFRWQVELYFKRLKSIMDFGELPKKRNDSIEAWLNGKLIVALLVEKLLSEVDFFPSA